MRIELPEAERFKPWKCFMFGWSVQHYGFGARLIQVYIGPLILRWHRR